MIYLMAYGISVGLMGVLDAVWLVTMTGRFYKVYLNALLAPVPNMKAGVLFYLLYVAGLTCFVTVPAIHSHLSLIQVALLGAFFGCVAYGTYDLTNLATIQNWPLIVSIVDLIWGATVSAVVAVLTVFLVRMKFL